MDEMQVDVSFTPTVFKPGFNPQLRSHYNYFQIRQNVLEDFHCILVHLLQGYRIDRVMAQNNYGIGDLRSRVSEIKSILGCNYINTAFKKYKRKDGRMANIKEYWMSDDAITSFWKTINTKMFFMPNRVSAMLRNGPPVQEMVHPCTD